MQQWDYKHASYSTWSTKVDLTKPTPNKYMGKASEMKQYWKFQTAEPRKSPFVYNLKWANKGNDSPAILACEKGIEEELWLLIARGGVSNSHICWICENLSKVNGLLEERKWKKKKKDYKFFNEKSNMPKWSNVEILPRN